MKVKIKRLSENAVIPKYALEGDGGQDLTATSKFYDEFGNIHYGTGLAFSIPEGFVGLLFPRSSNAKKDLILSNSVGVLDSNYTGEVSFKFKPSVVIFNKDSFASDGKLGTDDNTFTDIVTPTYKNFLTFQEFEIGDRIGQIIILPYPKIEFEVVDELEETKRGSGGFGSTGN
jgi:dUTP pyrophosphatase